MILAFDLGTETGYAFSVGGVIGSGVLNLKPRRFEGGGMRFLRFRNHICELVSSANTPATAIYYEEVRRHLGVDAAHVYGGLQSVLTTWAEENRVPYMGVPVGTIKKFWTGKGNADKAAMIRVAGERGFAPEDDNEADALALLHYVLEILQPKTAAS